MPLLGEVGSSRALSGSLSCLAVACPVCRDTKWGRAFSLPSADPTRPTNTRVYMFFFREQKVRKSWRRGGFTANTCHSNVTTTPERK